MRISVIIPAYNAEKYIEAALDSIFAQTTPAYEVIVVDDGSIDSTAEKVAGHAHATEIRLVRTDNNGSGPARNVGLNHATGDYVHFFDSDDLLDPGFLTTIAATLGAYPEADLVLFSGNSFRDDDPGTFTDSNFSRPFSAAELDGNQAVARLVKAGAVTPVPWLYVSRRSVWTRSHLCFKPIIHTDNEIFLKLVLCAGHVVVLQDVLVHRRNRPMSITTSPKTPGHAIGFLEAATTLVQLYAASSERPRVTRWAIRKRAIRNAQRYMRTCRKVGARQETRRMLGFSRTLRSPQLAAVTLMQAATRCRHR